MRGNRSYTIYFLSFLWNVNVIGGIIFMSQQLFETWLAGQNLSDTTKYNYLRGIRYIKKDLLHVLKNMGYEDVYDITELKQIEDLLNNQEFIIYDQKGNRMCSSGLKKYKEFFVLNIGSIDINEDNFKKWLSSKTSLTTKTISGYISAIRSLKKQLSHLVIAPEEFDLFKITDFGIIDQLMKETNFITIDEKWNKAHTSAINYYKKYLLSLKNGLENEEPENVDAIIKLSAGDLIPHIQTYIKSKGFNYSDANIKNLYLSLRSKPFVIISGISGTGKTKIVQLFAESIGATEQNGQFMLIPVRPDWSDGSELLGYTDIANNFKEGPLTKLLIHAKDHPERPHFLLLDEMNLARVEYYFSDILSVMESRALTADGYTSPKLGETATGDSLWFPGNLYIIGTVNMDETTHPFSKKVLDRANTLQFNDIDLLNFDFLKESTGEVIEPILLDNASLEAGYIQISHIYPQHEQLIEEVSQQLEEINAILKSIHAQVGYRVRDEICFYLAHNEDAEMLLSKNEALDFCYMQKILPHIAGSGERVEKVLTNLAQLLTKDAFPLCAAKIKEMQGRLGDDEFTAFW